ncbi:MAG: phosphoribosylglycinamide formyltransferase [Burkholderiales bacterium]|nr:MAG: phosphoribosylglycinamide formyltransferase [Burkholderiales bacterium]
MLAIADAARAGRWEQRHGARVAAVISNRPDAGGLLLASQRGLPTAVVDHTAYPQREAFEAALSAEIDRFGPSLVVLAGFMRILTPGFVARYEGRLVNIHPSLLPAFPGLHTHRRAIEAGCRFAGCTVHRVTTELDHGEYLDQAVVPVLPGDTPESLAARVLCLEHQIYPRAIERLVSA